MKTDDSVNVNVLKQAMQRLEKDMKTLQTEKQKLISDNLNLISENDNLKSKMLDIENYYQNQLLTKSNFEIKQAKEIQRIIEDKLNEANKEIGKQRD